MRYKQAKIISDKNDTKYYETANPVYVEKTNADIYVITGDGGRLDLLANQFYGDPMLWHRIADANNLNLINVKAGVRLRIPPKG